MYGAPALWTTDSSKYGEIYEIRHGTEREQRFAPKFGMEWATFSPDGTWLLTGSGDKTARLYDPVKGCGSGAQFKKFRHPDWVRCANFSRDGTMVCTACDDGNPRIFDARQDGPVGEEILKFGSDSERPALFADFSPDGALLVTAHWDRWCRIWQVAEPEQTVEPLHRFKHGNSVLCARFSSDNLRVCTASGTPRFNGLASVYDVETSEALAEIEQEDAVTSVSFSGDQKLLCTSSKDRTAQLIDLDTQLATMVWHHPNFVRTAALSPDGRYVCTSCDDGQARIFCTRTKAELLHFGHVDQVTCASFNFDGTQICTASQDGAVRVYGPVPQEKPAGKPS